MPELLVTYEVTRKLPLADKESGLMKGPRAKLMLVPLEILY